MKVLKEVVGFILKFEFQIQSNVDMSPRSSLSDYNLFDGMPENVPKCRSSLTHPRLDPSLGLTYCKLLDVTG